jgi:hypothetical protein
MATSIDVDAAGHPAHHHFSSHHSRPAVAASAVFRPTVRTVAVGYAPAYSYRQAQAFPRATVPALAYLPAASPNAPPFSFSESDQYPGWNWQRVSLQQIDTEVRAKRAGVVPTPPIYRKYCPDTRAYYPEVTRCESDWLTVLASP